MMEEYSNPPSVCSNTESKQAGNTVRRTPVLKLEKGKKGKIDVKAGQKIWDRMPLELQEDIEMHFFMEGESGGNSVGERLFTEVKDFCTTMAVPTVKELRRMIPKTVLLIFHIDHVARGREKIRDMWTEANRPPQWGTGDDFPRFADPNNGSKLQRSDLLNVYDFLQKNFQESELKIREQLGLDAEHKVVSLHCHKVRSKVRRALRDVDHVMHKMKLGGSSKKGIEDLTTLLNKVVVSDDNDILQIFDLTSSVQRLMLEMELEKKQMPEIAGACKKICEGFEAGQPACSTVQPKSDDVVQHYMENMDSSPLQCVTEARPNPLPVLTLAEKDICDIIPSEVISAGFKANALGEDILDISCFPASSVQSITSYSIDSLNHTPDHMLAQTSDTNAGSDILATICKYLDLDAMSLESYALPSEKITSDPGNTMMEDSTLQEFGNLFPESVDGLLIQQLDKECENAYYTKDLQMIETSCVPDTTTTTYCGQSIFTTTQMVKNAPATPFSVMGINDMEVE